MGRNRHENRYGAAQQVRRDFMNGVFEAFVRDAPRHTHVVFVDLVSSAFRFTEGLPGAAEHVCLRRMIVRRCQGHPDLVALAGVIEPSFNERKRKKWIQLELHACALVRASSPEAAKEKARKALRRSSDKERKYISRPCHVTTPVDDEGGAWGGLSYRSKSPHPGGVARRSGYRDHKRGNKRNTRDFKLRPSERRQLDEIWREVPPHRRLVLYGLKRYGGRYVRKDE